MGADLICLCKYRVNTIFAAEKIFGANFMNKVISDIEYNQADHDNNIQYRIG